MSDQPINTHGIVLYTEPMPHGEDDAPPVWAYRWPGSNPPVSGFASREAALEAATQEAYDLLREILQKHGQQLKPPIFKKLKGVTRL